MTPDPDFKTGVEVAHERGLAVAPLPEQAELSVRVSGLEPAMVEVLRKTTCAKFTEAQFLLYLAICKIKGLDPFTEAYGFPSSEGGLSFGLRIDGMRSLAMRTGQYLSREVDSLFVGEDGIEIAEPGPNRKLVGAQCIVRRSGMERPVVEAAYLAEYDTGKFLWATHKETMIRKVAESKALRAAFPDALAGVYEPAEIAGEK